jgi:hypothetical protein
LAELAHDLLWGMAGFLHRESSLWPIGAIGLS